MNRMMEIDTLSQAWGESSKKSVRLGCARRDLHDHGRARSRGRGSTVGRRSSSAFLVVFWVLDVKSVRVVSLHRDGCTPVEKVG